jgi:hypothetical protein
MQTMKIGNNEVVLLGTRLAAGDADPGQAFVKAVLGFGVRASRRDAARCASATAPGAVTSRVS